MGDGFARRLELRGVRRLTEQQAAGELPGRRADQHVLGRDLCVAQAALERALVVDRARAAEAERGLGDGGAGAGRVGRRETQRAALLHRHLAGGGRIPPRLADRLVQERAGGAQARLGARGLRLGGGALGERARAAGRGLRRRQRDEIVERAAADAQAHARDGDRQQAEERERVERPGGRRPVGEDRDAVAGRDPKRRELDVVAAGRAQARDAPGVVDDHLPGGRQHQRHVGLAIREPAQVVALLDDAAAHQPVAVPAAARERPAPRHAESVLRGGRPAARREHAAGDRLRVAVDQPRRLIVQVPGEQPARRVDGDAPAGGAVAARELLDRLDERAGRRLESAQRCRHAHAKEPGLDDPVDEPRREAALLLALGRELGGGGGEGPGC